jgi:rare lipoprotein A
MPSRTADSILSKLAPALLLLGCSRGAAPAQPAGAFMGPVAPPAAAVPASWSSPAAPFEVGQASYYADSLAGNATASGEPYAPAALTAAHRKLPFGTVVDVVRDDGRAVRVRINDRGPFVSGRVIDLSRAAAEQLGMMRAGVVPVRLYVVWQPPKS